MTTESEPMTVASSAGTSQLATEVGAILISANTSPGAAKTFSNRPASDIVGVWEPEDCDSGIDGMSSMFAFGLTSYLGKIWPKLQEMSAIFYNSKLFN
jgi:hypothetical protein